jgi:hypothetical protein
MNDPFTQYHNVGIFRDRRKIEEKGYTIATSIGGVMDTSIEDRAKNILTWFNMEIDYKERFLFRPYRHPLEVLKKRKGICLDSSILYVLMARSAGIHSCIGVQDTQEHAIALIKDDKKETVGIDVTTGRYEVDDVYRYNPHSDKEIIYLFRRVNLMQNVLGCVKSGLISLAFGTAMTIGHHAGLPIPTGIQMQHATTNLAENILEDFVEYTKELDHYIK